MAKGSKKDLPSPSGITPLGYVDPRGYEYAIVDIDLLVPDTDNPRIPTQESILETILAVITNDADGLYKLAQDIVAEAGTNPGELPSVVRQGDHFVVKEGNRRLVVRKILENPEMLRGHVTAAESKRWVKLAGLPEAKRLPDRVLVVIGDTHDPWMDRRHLGLQGGVGISPWGPQAKARRDEQRRGIKDRSLSLLEALRAFDEPRFGPLNPPKRTFTTFTRILDSPDARAHIGLDVDASGQVRLNRGERSLQIIERILLDLQRTDDERLTSRTIHTVPQISEYLNKVESQLSGSSTEVPLTLAESSKGATSAKKGGATAKVIDPMKSLNVPSEHRIRKLFEELRAVRRAKQANSAMILVRVILELSIDHYAANKGLKMAGDVNPTLEAEIDAFRKEVLATGMTIPRSVKSALRFAATKPMSLVDKLSEAIAQMVVDGSIVGKEAEAKKRELKAADILPILNDAVHRLQNVPSIERVNHVIDVLRPILNAIH